MSQGLSKNQTIITDSNGDIAAVEDSQLLVRDQTVEDLLMQQSAIIDDVMISLEHLFQTGPRSAAASLPISVASDNTVNVAMRDTVVTGMITSQSPSSTSPGLAPGSYVEILLNGHSFVTITTMATNNTGAYAVFLSIDRINWVNPQGGVFSSDGTVVSSGSYFSTASPLTLFVPCSGFKAVRISNFSFIGETFVTMRASYSKPINFINALINTSIISPWSTVTSFIYPRALTVNGNCSLYVSLTPTTINKLTGVSRIGFSNNTPTILYGVITNNPNDFSVYLIFWSASSKTAGKFDISSQSIGYYISIPPGQTSMLPNFYGLYSSDANGYLFSAISMSSTSYVPVPLGVDTTFYTCW